MVLEPVHCPDCDGTQVIKHGKTPEGKQRYRCQDQECKRSTFIREYSYAGLLPEVKQQICDMAINGSGIRDTARVLGVSQKTVIATLKKSPELKAVNEVVLARLEPTQTIVRLCLAPDAADAPVSSDCCATACLDKKSPISGPTCSNR